MSSTPLVAEGRKEYKDEQLLARLIGAAVLLAIAVIVLPFVLDGAGSQREYEYAETFPVQPERQVVETSYSSRQPLPEAPGVEDIPVITTAAAPVLAPQPAPAADADTSVAIDQPAETITQSGGSVLAGSNAGNSVTQGLPVQSNSQGSAIVTAANQEIPPGYNIQVASFLKDGNALKLLNRLRGENLPAYVNRVDGKKRAIFRVFIGPINSQIDALALKNRIDRSYRVDSIMVTRN